MNNIYTRHLYWSSQKLEEDVLAQVAIAEKIALRERWSFNEFLYYCMKEYNHRHKEGNVSFQLDKFNEPGFKAVSVEKKEQFGICGFRSCNTPAIGLAVNLRDGKQYSLCKLHFDVVKHAEKSWKVAP